MRRVVAVRRIGVAARWFDRLAGVLISLSGGLSGVAIFFMTILVAVGVVARYLVHKPLLFVDEYSAYGLVFIVYLATAQTMREEGHIRVALFTGLVGPRIRLVLRVLTTLLSLIYASVLTWQSASYVAYLQKVGERSLTVMMTPTWMPAFFIPVGCFLLSLQLVISLARDFAALFRPLPPGAPARRGIRE
jgi:TRAP-type C4-dicarboxylate transport system permease small subunit